MITRWNNGRCIGCGRSRGEYHRDDCQEVAEENRHRRQDNLALLMRGGDETARPEPAGREYVRWSERQGFRTWDDPAETDAPPQIKYLPSRTHDADLRGEILASIDIPNLQTHYDPTARGTVPGQVFIGVDMATGPDWSAIFGIRVNADGTTTFLTEAEVAAERYRQARPLPTKTAKDRQLLALLDAHPMMVSEGITARRGTAIERQLADELTVLKNENEALRGLVANGDGWRQTARNFAQHYREVRRKLVDAEIEIEDLKAAAVSRETPPAPSKSEVMGRAIGVTLAGWKPVV